MQTLKSNPRSREQILREVHERLRAADAMFIQALHELKAQLESIAKPLPSVDDELKVELGNLSSGRRRVPRPLSWSRATQRPRSRVRTGEQLPPGAAPAITAPTAAVPAFVGPATAAPVAAVIPAPPPNGVAIPPVAAPTTAVPTVAALAVPVPAVDAPTASSSSPTAAIPATAALATTSDPATAPAPAPTQVPTATPIVAPTPTPASATRAPPQTGYVISLRLSPTATVNLVAALIASVLLAELLQEDKVWGPFSITKDAMLVFTVVYMCAVYEMELILYQWLWGLCRRWWNAP